MRKINASEFKAKCLSILDDVDTSGETVTILKRGRPVARLVPPLRESEESPQSRLRGTVKIKGDIIGPALPSDAWDAERRGPS